MEIGDLLRQALTTEEFFADSEMLPAPDPREFESDSEDETPAPYVPPRGMQSLPPHRFVAAIDFGNMYSGLAFFFRDDPEPKITVNSKWRKCDRVKTSTSVMLRKDLSLQEFGDAAQVAFYNMDPEQAQNVFFFERFKMALMRKWNDTKKLSKDTTLSDVMGRKIPAMHVIAESLAFMKRRLEERLRVAMTHTAAYGDTLWVLSVPGVWSESGKQFMRLAAVKAGLAHPDDPTRVIVALEPEAAAVFCKELTVNSRLPTPNSGFARMGTGESYMIIDAGGGTVDITSHELLDYNAMQELYPACGGPWGGDLINEAFYALVEDICGRATLEALRVENPPQNLELKQALETAKRSWDFTDRNCLLRVPLPNDLVEIHRRLYIEQTKVKVSPLEAMRRATEAFCRSTGRVVHYQNGALRIGHDETESFFKIAADPLCRQLEELLQQPSLRPVTRVFMVGGFSECNYLQMRVKRVMEPQVTVLVPLESTVAVLKGAVMFGRAPCVISQRIAKLTYGIVGAVKYRDGHHRDSRRFCKEGKHWCRGVFHALIKKGQPVPVGEQIESHFTYEMLDTCNGCFLNIGIYCSEETEVKYDSDPGLTQIGRVQIQVPESFGSNKHGCRVIFNFSQTEIAVTGVDVRSGRAGAATVDFLSF